METKDIARYYHLGTLGSFEMRLMDLIGNADLEKQGGPEEKSGFKESENDITKIGKKNNNYNVRGYSYGDDNDPGLGCDGPLPTGKGNAYSGIVGEEDEESGKKPDKDGDGVPDWADEHDGEDDHAKKKNKKRSGSW